MHIRIGVSSVMPFLFGTFLLFSGCATIQSYEGAKQPPENVALIKESFGVINRASILEVDGKAHSFFEESSEILPGEHIVKIQVITGLGSFMGPQRIGNKTLSFQASAGHTYKVDGKIKKEGTFAWIVDETTNEVVAGERP